MAGRPLLVSAGCLAATACGLFTDLDGYAGPRALGPPSEAGATADANAPSALKVDVVARSQDRPHWIVLDPARVYWINESNTPTTGERQGQVVSLARQAGAQPTVLASGIANIALLAQDSTSLHFTEGELVGCSPHWISTIRKTGSGRTQIAHDCDPSFGLGVDATDFYWLGLYGSLKRIPKSPGGVEVELTPQDNGAQGFAMKGMNVYRGNARRHTIERVEKTGANLRLFVAEQSDPVAIDADDAFVYWITNPGGSVARLAQTSPGGAAEVLARGEANLTALALTSSDVYFLSADDGALKRVGKSGGAVETLTARLFTLPCGLAADDDAAYVTDCDAGTVTRVGK